MISYDSALLATNIADSIIKRGKSLNVKPNTLISELNVPLSYITNYDIEKISDNINTINESVASTIQNFSTGKFDNKTYQQSPHDVIIDNAIEEIKEKITKEFNFARTVVNPIVSQFTEEIIEITNNVNKGKTAESLFNISYYNIFEFFTSDYVKSEINNYPSVNIKGKKIDDINRLNYNVIIENNIDIIEYISSSIPKEYLNSFYNWVNSIGADKLKSYIINNLNDKYLMSNSQLCDYSLINFLFHHVYNNKLDLKLATSLVRAKEYANYAASYYATLYSINFGYLQNDIKQQKIFAEFIDNKFSIFNNNKIDLVIYEPSFIALTEKGASLETIFGLLSEKIDQTCVVDTLVNNKEYYTNKWNTVRGLYQLHLDKTSINIIKYLVKAIFDDYVEKTKDTVMPLTFNYNNYIVNVTEKANTYINNLNIENFESDSEIEEISIDLIAGILFKDTNAYGILYDMFTTLKNNESLTANEAAVFAAIRYIVSYFTKQIM